MAGKPRFDKEEVDIRLRPDPGSATAAECLGGCDGKTVSASWTQAGAK